MVVEEDLVFLRSLYRGVHQGEWRGLALTGKEMEWEAWQVLRIENDLIVEERMLMDEWSLWTPWTQKNPRSARPKHLVRLGRPGVLHRCIGPDL